MKNLIMLGVGLLCFVFTQAQTREYQIIRKGKSIGHLQTDYQKSNGQSVYAIESHAAFWMVGTIEVDYKSRAVYSNQELVEMEMEEKVNGSVRASGSLKKQNNQYVHKTGNNAYKKLNNQNMAFHSGMLYFHEPVDMRKVFSDKHGKYLEIIPKGNGQYDMLLPSGYKNTFSYSDGVCKQIQVNHKLGTIYIKIKNPS